VFLVHTVAWVSWVRIARRGRLPLRVLPERSYARQPEQGRCCCPLPTKLYYELWSLPIALTGIPAPALDDVEAVTENHPLEFFWRVTPSGDLQHSIIDSCVSYEAAIDQLRLVYGMVHPAFSRVKPQRSPVLYPKVRERRSTGGIHHVAHRWGLWYTSGEVID
jgi:hypothetical protein